MRRFNYFGFDTLILSMVNDRFPDEPRQEMAVLKITESTYPGVEKEMLLAVPVKILTGERCNTVLQAVYFDADGDPHASIDGLLPHGGSWFNLQALLPTVKVGSTKLPIQWNNEVGGHDYTIEGEFLPYNGKVLPEELLSSFAAYATN